MTDLAALDARLAALKPQIAAAAEAAKAARASAKAGMAERLRELNADRADAVSMARQCANWGLDLVAAKPELQRLSALAGQRRAAKKAGDAAEIARLNSEIAPIRRALQDSGSGAKLWWSNANAVVAAYDVARAAAMKSNASLNFHAWRGAGRLVNQLQDGGISVEDFLRDGHAQVALTDAPAGFRGGRGRNKRAPRHALEATACSDGKTRTTVSAAMIMHRPLPKGATVKQVVVQRRKIANDPVYSAVFTCTVPAHPKAQPIGALTSINFGWRRVDGGLRVATVLCGGQIEHVILPEAMLDKYAEHEDMQSQRDKLCNAIIAELRALDWSAAPEAMAGAVERFRRAPKPGPAGVARIAGVWPEGWRDEVRARVLAWRSEDRFIWRNQAHGRDKWLGRRKDFYRCAALHIAARASEIVTEDFDMGEAARLVSRAGAETAIPAPARRNRVMAAPSELRLAIELAARKRGVPVRKHEGPSTGICHACGARVNFAKPARANQICGACQALWDQDENAVRTMLAS